MELTGVDERFFRDVLGHYPTGVAAITSMSNGTRPIGMVVGSFTSVSLDPPLVGYLAAKTSSSYAQLRQQDRFCVNILSDQQEDVCRSLAIRDRTDKFDGLAWRRSPLGSPIVDGALAWIDCEVADEVDAGDHYLVLGRVTELEVGRPGLPLVFHNGGYGSFTPRSRVLPATPDTLAQIRLADLARPVMDELTRDLGMECAVMAAIDDVVVRLASVGAPRIGSGPIQVGQRMPFWAPLGALLVAWADEPVQRRWIARGPDGVDPAQVDAHLAALRRVRDRGWLISMITPEFEALDRVLTDLPDGPEKAARIRDLESRLGGPHAYDHERLEFDRSYDVRNVSVPVFGADDTVPMYLSLFGFPKPSLGFDILHAVERLLACAGRVAERLPR